MWLFASQSFLSIVDKGDPIGKTLLVRACRAGDIECMFPDAEVQVGGGSDYRYRARIGREQVADAIAEAVRTIKIQQFQKHRYGSRSP